MRAQYQLAFDSKCSPCTLLMQCATSRGQRQLADPTVRSMRCRLDKPAITRDMIVTISGLVILFAGALDGVFRAPLGRFFAARRRGGA